jgi:hypothetical protein
MCLPRGSSELHTDPFRRAACQQASSPSPGSILRPLDVPRVRPRHPSDFESDDPRGRRGAVRIEPLGAEIGTIFDSSTAASSMATRSLCHKLL